MLKGNMHCGVCGSAEHTRKRCPTPELATRSACVVCGGPSPLRASGPSHRATCSDACLFEMRRRSVTTHGGSRSPLYVVWSAIVQRTTNPANQDWPLYGGRGITMCDRWRASYAAFVIDMGPRPPRGMVERIDNDGPYSPENCRWASPTEQARNRRNSRRYEWRGELLTIPEWSERTGFSATTLKRRLVHLRWSVERALTEPAIRGKNQTWGARGAA